MRIAIVEDEQISANELVALISKYDANIIVESITDTIEDTLKYLENTVPDLLFLDIELADGLSFEIFNHLQIDCPIVFLTAYDEYALKAFDQNSISYLLKPITYSKLVGVFRKLSSLKRVLKADLENISIGNSHYKENFLVKRGSKLIPVPTKNINYFYSKENLTFLVTQDDQKHISSNNLFELETMLDSSIFFRVNRQYIVNRSSVTHLETHVKGQVTLCFGINGTNRAVISRQKTREIKKWLEM